MKNKLKKFWKKIIVITIFIVSMNGSATNYYVSTTGNNSNNGTSLSTAFRTISKVVSIVNPGDVVNVADGNYGEYNEITRSGNSSNWITFKSINKWGAKAQSFVVKADYIIVDGFEVVNPDTYGTGIKAEQGRHHITFRNNKSHDCGEAGVSAYDCDYITIEYNVCYKNGYLMPQCGSGISIYGGLNFDGANTERMIVRGNISYSNENGPNTNRTDGNGIIIDDLKNSQSYHLQSIQGRPFNGKILVENNVVYDNGGRGMYIMSSSNATFRNNTAYKNSRLLGGGELVCHDASNITWVNNIAWTNNLSGRTAICDDGAWGNNSNIVWKNNLAFNGTTGQNSTKFARTTTTGIDNTNKQGVNPLFVNVGNNDFKLQSSSPAINSGTNSYGLSNTDIEGNTRVQGVTVDMGSYESAGSNTTVAVTGVSVSPTSATINIDETKQLSATITPSNATNQNISWSSSNTAVATVNASGLVKGIAAGNATITVTTQDGNRTATTAITVNTGTTNTTNSITIGSAPYSISQTSTNALSITYAASQAGSIWVGLFDANWAYVGGSTNYNVNANTNGTVTVNSSVSNIAVGSGYKWFVELRDTNNTGVSGTGKTQDNVSVVANVITVTGVSTNPTSATINVDETKQLSATITPSNAANQNVSWSSSNTAVATVNTSGLVKGIAAGNATITVTTQDGNKTATSTITVNANVINSITIASAPSSISQTSTNALSITYAASQAGSIWVGLFDANWAYVGGSTNYNVNANTNGTVTVNSSVSNIAVGTGYKWYVELRDTNNTGISGTLKTQDNVSVVANTTFAPDLTIQAESFCAKNAVNTWNTGAGGFTTGGYLKYCNVNLGTGYNTLKMSLATANGGKFYIRKGSATGTIIGTLNFTQTGGWNTFNTQSCTLTGASGIQDIFITTGTGTANVDYIVFTNVNSTVRNTDATNLKESVITFPNPATDQLNVNYKLTSDSTVNVSLYDMSGNKVKSSTKKQTQGDQTLSIETTDVKNGLYFIKITANGQEATQKVMIKN